MQRTGPAADVIVRAYLIDLARKTHHPSHVIWANRTLESAWAERAPSEMHQYRRTAKDIYRKDRNARSA